MPPFVAQWIGKLAEMIRIPQVVFIGMPGSGKTRIGKEVASVLGVHFYDSDDEIERRESKSISDIFAQYGEEEFRAIERETIANFLIHGAQKDREDVTFSGVLSLGGGAPMNEKTREVLHAYADNGGTIVYLDAHPDEAIERATRSGNRPLLKKNPRSAWMNLFDQRDPVFRKVATFIMSTHGKTPRQVAQTVIETMNEKIVHVSGANPEYDVRIGTATMRHLPEILGQSVVRVALIHTSTVQRHSDKARAILRRAGYDVTDMVIPDAEAGKTISVVEHVWDQLGSIGFTRSDAIVGLGGGAATDVAGFIAATWLRGITYVNCPTSLLAMVDASTGGKTGINTAAGKNLAGSFYTPAGVLADVDTLKTLDHRIFTEGLGEVIKAGFIADPQILDIVEENAAMLREVNPSQITEEQMDVIVELIERSVTVKQHHVSSDLHERGLREFLNYGHTLGHAIEKIEHFTWRHGEAVSVGMVFAAELAHIHGIVNQSFVDYTRSILESVGLPTSWASARVDDVLALMHRDKKARGNTLRFIVVDEIGHAMRLEGPDEDSVREALKRTAVQA